MRVLGIAGHHDGGAVVINDGKVETYLKEERLCGIKREGGPFKAFTELLSRYGDNIDHLAVVDPYPNFPEFAYLFDRLFPAEKNLIVAKVDYSQKHHLTHASLAFYNSGFEESLIFVIDRNGSLFNSCLREAETVFQASYPANFKTLHKNFWVLSKGSEFDASTIEMIVRLKQANIHSFNADSLMSIVKVYESATTLIGEHSLENGKTMGLSSYGEDKPYKDLFLNGRPIDNYFVQDFFVPKRDNPQTALLIDHLDRLTNEITKENYQFYADYAYQVQKQTQEQVLRFVSEWVNKTGIKKVCITGGYGLNVVSNENLIRNLPNVEFYFEPMADDSGNCIGAAMHLYRELTNDNTINKLKTTQFHGYRTELQQIGQNCSSEDIAKFLSDGKIVAVFNGLAEAGPRALGNRSILFDPRNPNAKDIVNEVKKREWYRPFAGMILENRFEEYFVTHGLKSSENMTVSFRCKKSNEIPGVIHVDNTCRVQTVNDSLSHIYFLLREFESITGCPVLLNTSFNLAGKPLIETQKEAIDCFMSSDIDVLWF
ncbi:hypothetical protein EB001_23755, partial [bacterium]|nr:hypothetical protein [bacterium]